MSEFIQCDELQTETESAEERSLWAFLSEAEALMEIGYTLNDLIRQLKIMAAKEGGQNEAAEVSLRENA